ncbi:MAG: hypothetical protein BroJett030_32470 [Alphaproteobacteria bacterium]|nr:MAG: hypothetical protein BroJett030_32470 [Alphaproteobacteria bacterium]
MQPLDSEDQGIYRIAIASDDAAEREAIGRQLGDQARFVLHHAADQEALRRFVDDERCEAVLIGERFGGCSGLEVHEQIRAERRHPPGTVLIGPESFTTVIKAFRCGIADYLTRRSITGPQLRATVMRAVEVTRRRRARAAHVAQLQRSARKDALTGLPNRAYLCERIEKMVRTARRDGTVFGIVAVRFGDIGAVYSAYGQKVGDQVLRACAERLREAARRHDLFGQYSDDTFMFLVDREVEPHGLQAICRRLSGSTDFLLALDSLEIRLSADIHAVLYPADGAGAAQLLGLIERQIEARRPSAADRAPTQPEPAVAREGDRRLAHRHRVLKRGMLILNDGFSTINCIIRDISIGGARVAVDGEFTAPKFMELLMVEKNEKIATETRWQNGNLLGLKFMTSQQGLHA